MTAPIQEPSVYRTQSGHSWSIGQLARRPVPVGASCSTPWIILYGGSTDIPTDTWIPVPLPNVTYDPNLVTIGATEIYNLVTTDQGDTGTDRLRLSIKQPGIYSISIQAYLSEVTTVGAVTDTAAVMSVRGDPGGADGGVAEGNLSTFWRVAEDWNWDVSNSELILNGGYLEVDRIFVLAGPNLNQRIEPWVYQGSGSTYTLGGEFLTVVQLCSDVTDSDTWTYEDTTDY